MQTFISIVFNVFKDEDYEIRERHTACIIPITHMGNVLSMKYMYNKTV